MILHSGETANITGDCKCENCNSRMHIKRGNKIPKCPTCGHDSFESSGGELRDLENF